jgi:arylsulfatase A-like enzyme
MPHPPYYFKKEGTEASNETLIKQNTFNKEQYIEYLIYTNTKLLSLIDHIKESTVNPIIILMSDHGFCQFPDTTKTNYRFFNLNAIYLPSGDYKGFYEGMTNVNQFRTILNTVFGQKMPILKDSTIVIHESKLKN